jgi:hypothetical protein
MAKLRKFNITSLLFSHGFARDALDHMGTFQSHWLRTRQSHAIARNIDGSV